MKDSRAYIFSAVLHLLVVVLFFVNLPFMRSMSLTPPPIVPIEIVTIDQLTQSPLKKQRQLPKAARTKKIVHTRTRKEQIPTPALKQEVKNVTKNVIEKVALKPIKALNQIIFLTN